jgi:CubicO group peptidase (beta-lactamase class C family)
MRKWVMRYSVFLTGLFVVVLLAVSRLTYAPDSGPFQAQTDTLRALDTSLGDALPWRGIPGASVAVLKDGSVTELWASGVDNMLTRTAITPDTVFEVASLSKPLTAYAVLRLVQDGQLDLDAPVRLEGYEFTIRQVLSHSAGFDNSLSQPPVPVTDASAFSYAGTGYLWLGTEIERVTGQSFADHMNQVVLPELGMSNSHFGRADSDDTQLASPHMSVLLPFLVFALVALVIALPLLGLHKGVRRLLGGHHDRPARWLPRLIFAIAVLAGLGVPWILFGGQNYAVLVTSNIIYLTAASLLFLSFRSTAGVALRIAAVLSAGLIAFSLLARPAVPLHERRASFLPAAGLRTTAADYATFLARIMQPTDLDAELAAQMLTPQVAVNADQDWALGITVQRGDQPVIWHWGVNFPGYQAFAMAWPETGDGMVVLMNGGPMSFSPGGMRYGGLELAREAVIAVHGGSHSAYWQDAQ